MIEDGSYGYCEETGEPIGVPRLIARPMTTLVGIEAQERRERVQANAGVTRSFPIRDAISIHRLKEQDAMFTLPPLPYAENALDPVISANTLSFHYGKHHKAYVDNLNNLAKGTSTNPLHLKVIRETAGKADKVGLFNNSAQVWNHTFYWNSPRGAAVGSRPAASPR